MLIIPTGFLFFALSAAFSAEPEIGAILRERGLSFSVPSGSRVEVRSVDGSGGGRGFFMKLKTPDEVVIRMEQITGLSTERSAAWFHRRIQEMDSAFRPHQIPYAGLISRSTACDQEFQPVHVGAPEKSPRHVMLFATKDLLHGVCERKDLFHDLHILFIPCPGDRANVLEIFLPLNGKFRHRKLPEWVRSPKCL